MNFTVAKGDKNMCAEATDVTVILQDVVPKHVDKTASDILGPLWNQRFNYEEGKDYCVRTQP